MRIFKAIGSALWQPRQIMIINDEVGLPPRHLQFRPGVIIITALLLILASLLTGFFLSHGTVADPDLMPQYLQLQRNNSELQTKLADREASISIMQAQIAQFKKEGTAMRSKIKAQGVLIDEYSSVLDAMKQTGIQLIHPQATWSDPQTLSYNFIVVKGGNFPRSMVGYFKCYVTDPTSGKQITVPLYKGKEKLPYKVINDTFVDGQINWKQKWRPASLQLVRYDLSNREKGRYTITIKGVN